MATIQNTKKISSKNLDLVDKDPKKINSQLYNFVLSLIDDLKQKGLDYRIFEGYRSNERQDYLFSVKKTTSLKAGQSKHNKLPSEAISLVQYIKNQPVWGGNIQGSDFRNIVNNKLLNYPNIIWGGNWKNPVPYQFEIIITETPKVINPPQIQPSIKPVSIVPPIPQVSIVNPVEIPENPFVPARMDDIKPAPLVPASVKMEVDNSTIIVLGLLLGAYIFLKK
jgi:hypothetical protein